MSQGNPTAGPVFLYGGPGREREPAVPVRQGNYKKSLKANAKAAGIERWEQVTPYLLRHSFATIAWMLGIEMDVARRIMRHTDETMLREVYCRPAPTAMVDRVKNFTLIDSGKDEEE